MAVTIKDIAVKANVSYTSVSRALNGKKGVSEETRRQVLAIAEEMGYFPNALARGLVQRRTYTLGLLIPDIINPFFPEIAKGVDEAARKEGYNMFLCNTGWDTEKERRYIDLMAEKQVDGLISLPAREGANYEYAKKRLGERIPMVFLSATPQQGSAMSISTDNSLGSRQMIGHLVDRGYRRIAFVGGQSGMTGVEERLDGYRRAVEASGLTLRDEYIIESGFGFENGYEAVQQLLGLELRPQAVFAENDNIALGVLHGLREKGLRVPQDMAVAGFDDIPIAGMYGIRLTTVRQPKYQMGQLAVNMLLNQLAQDGESARVRKVVLDPELIIREST